MNEQFDKRKWLEPLRIYAQTGTFRAILNAENKYDIVQIIETDECDHKVLPVATYPTFEEAAAFLAGISWFNESQQSILPGVKNDVIG